MSAAFNAITRQPRIPLDRPAQPLTYELGNHAKAYLEAEQYAVGYDFLSTVLATGTSVSTPARRFQASLAPPPHLALASTLIVYPATTTKANSAAKVKGSDAALRYLRTVQSTIAPDHETLRSAFIFPDERLRRRVMASRADNGSPDLDSDVDRLAGLAANGQSLWHRATDFWHAVGWAFNCSVLHLKRWERWRLWLEIMLDFLEAEWEARLRKSRGDDVDTERILTDSLVWHYISSEDPTNRNHRRRMVRAILAMGTSQSKTLFPEVWQNETVPAKQTKPEKNHLADIDIENGELGEFKNDEDNEPMQDVIKTSSRKSNSRRALGTDEPKFSKEEDHLSTPHDSEEAITRLGGIEAIVLRQRLICLLAKVAEALPTQFTTLGDYFDPFTEEIVRLPSLVFSVLLSTSRLPGLSRTALNANLLLPLMPGRLPDYTRIEPEQEHLEKYLLPHRATTQSYAANAKISLLLEQIFIYMLDSKSLKASGDLRQAVEKGIEQRHGAFGTARGRKSNPDEEEQGKRLMETSSQRLLGLLEILEISSDLPPQPLKSELLSFTSNLPDSSTPPENGTDEDGSEDQT